MMSVVPDSANSELKTTFVAKMVLLVTLVGTIANAAMPNVLQASHDVGGLPDIGVSKLVLICAMLGMFRLLQTSNPADLLPSLLPAAIGAVTRSADAAWLGLAISMYILLKRDDLCSKARDGALILLAVGLHGPVVSMFGLFFGADILTFDAKIAAAVLSLTGTPVSASATSLSVKDGMDLVLVWRCGVLNNLSIALLLWYSATQFVLGRIPLQALTAAVLVIAVMVLANSLRIAAMALNSVYFEYLHDGQGATLLRIATMVCIAFIISKNLRRLAR